jgi:hypothetical protein
MPSAHAKDASLSARVSNAMRELHSLQFGLLLSLVLILPGAKRNHPFFLGISQDQGELAARFAIYMLRIKHSHDRFGYPESRFGSI